MLLSEVQDLVIPLTLWYYFLRFQTLHFIKANNITYYVQSSIELHIHILHLHSEKPICNLEHFLFPFVGHSDWRLAVRMNLLLIFVCVVCGGPSCPFIVLRLWELITELTSSSSSNPMWHISDLSSRLFRSLIIYWNDWWLVRKLLVYLFILFIYFCVWECSDCEEM